MSVSVVIGPLYDMGYCRILIIIGTFLITTGFMLTSIGTLYWHIFLAQGICIGLGTSFISVPSIAIVPMYFVKRRARAMSLATVGSGLGSTLYPLMFQNLQAEIGFPWALRIMGFLSLTLCIFSVLVIRPPPSQAHWKQGRPSIKWFIDTSAFHETTYILYCTAIFFNNLVFFNSPYYLQSYALTHGMATSPLAHYLIAILNACTIPGRIIPSFFVDRFGPLDTYIVVCAFASASVFYWISATSAAGNIAFAVIYGFFSGGVVALATVVITAITPDLGRLGTRLGMVSIIKGVGSLVGPPVSGAILARTGGFLGIQLFSALGLMLTTVFSVALRIVLVRRQIRALPGMGVIGGGSERRISSQ